MKRQGWKKISMIALALCLWGVSMNGHGDAWAASNPALEVDEFGYIGIILNGVKGSGNGASPETIPNLLAILIVAASLLGVALVPNPYQEKREKKLKPKPGPFANCRKGRNSPHRNTPRLTAIDNTLSATSPLSLR
jgi:hypothetical protein